MQGTEQPSRAPLTLFALNTPEAIKDYAYGCDADVGGTSTVHFDFDDDPAHKPPTLTGDNKNKLGAARFHGHMRLAVRPGYENSIRGGYAGFRNKVCCWVFKYPSPQVAKNIILYFAHSSVRRYSESLQTTCRIIAFSPYAYAPRVIRARAARTLSTYRRTARRMTIYGNIGYTLRATMVGGKMSLCVSRFRSASPCHLFNRGECK